MRSKILIILALSVGMSLGFVVSSLFKPQIKNQVLSTNTQQADDPASATSSPQVSTSPAVVIFRDRVSKVIDGDTVVLESGETVRYIGIDSPERSNCYSDEATEGNRALVEGKEVRLEKDVSEKDKYGRLLRFLYIAEGADQDVFVNDYLVRQGFAMAYRYPPDVAFSDQFEQAEQEARDNNRGLWNSCTSASSSESDKPGLSTYSKPSLGEGDKDCKDFTTHAEAQAFFEAAGAGDPHRLDSDGDGQACETLP